MGKSEFLFVRCGSVRRKGAALAHCDGIMAGVTAEQQDPLVAYCAKCREFYQISFRDGLLHGRKVKPDQISFHTAPYVLEE
jgi:hypothetical protein